MARHLEPAERRVHHSLLNDPYPRPLLLRAKPFSMQYERYYLLLLKPEKKTKYSLFFFVSPRYFNKGSAVSHPSHRTMYLRHVSVTKCPLFFSEPAILFLLQLVSGFPTQNTSPPHFRSLPVSFHVTSG